MASTATPTRERRYTKFKVTSAKPSEVEGALQQGWKLVNCSLSMREDSNARARSIVAGEHCYFEGDEHVGDEPGAPKQP